MILNKVLGVLRQNRLPVKKKYFNVVFCCLLVRLFEFLENFWCHNFSPIE